MQDDGNYLFGGEEVSLVVRRHPIVLAKPALGPLAALVLLAAVPHTITFIIFLIVLGRFAWEYGLWYVDRYILTTNRILSTGGLITKEVVSMPLSKMTDATYTRSVVGRLFGYGKLHLESAGQVGLEFIDYLPDPDHFYRTIMELALSPEEDEQEAAGPQPIPVILVEPVRKQKIHWREADVRDVHDLRDDPDGDRRSDDPDYENRTRELPAWKADD